jgi:hypothetical protein
MAQMSKYTLAKLNGIDVLPVDCNAEADRLAMQYKDAGLMAMMKLFREKKITGGYGEATHLNAGGSPEIIFSFQRGICKHASPLKWVDQRNVAKGSIKFFYGD